MYECEYLYVPGILLWLVWNMFLRFFHQLHILEFWAIRKVTMEIHLKRWWWSHWNTSIYFSCPIRCPVLFSVTSYISFPREYLYSAQEWPNSCVVIAACGWAKRCTCVSDRLFRWSSVGPTQWRVNDDKAGSGDPGRRREGHPGEAPWMAW